ncbi:MAG: SGNH/GDSL hydrolase family protein [Lachnospiraceae bacterium]
MNDINHIHKKQILKAIIFILGFLFLLRTVTYVIRTNGSVKDRFVGFYAEPKDTLDVVIVGSSPVYPCFSGAKIWGESGITCYPLSSNMQPVTAALPLVKEIRKTQQPQLLIFEIKQFTTYANDIGYDKKMAYTRGVTDNMKYSLNRIDAIHRMVEEPAERLTYYFDIFKYHSNWKTMVMPSQLACWRYEHLAPMKGFEFKDGYRPVAYTDYSTDTDVTPIPPDKEEALRELLDYLQANGLQSLFIVAPYAYEFAEKQQNYNYMQQIIEEYDYEFLNLNDHLEEIGFDFATDFYDGGVHTNAVGGEKCTAFLTEYLTKHYTFADKRGDAAYHSWDTAYTQWCEQMERSRVKIKQDIENQTPTVLEEAEE